MSEWRFWRHEFVLFRAGAKILGIFSTAKALFFVSFFWANKRKRRNCIKELGSTFFLKKKVAKKTLAMLKMPKPSFAGALRKTILNLNDMQNQSVKESRFSH